MRRTLRAAITMVAAVVVTVLTAAAACEPTSPPPEASSGPAPGGATARPPMTVGIPNDIPGIGELTSPGDNARTGFDVDLARWLGKHTTPGFEPVLVDVTIADRDRAIATGRLTLVIDVLSITDARRETIGMAGPYLLSRQGVLTRAGDTRINTTKDLKGKFVCTIEGSTSLAQLGPLQRDLVLTTEKGNSGCIRRLLNGEVDAFSTDQIILQAFAQRDPGRLAVTPVTFGKAEEYGVGYPKGDVRTCTMLREGIQEFIISNTWDQFFSSNFPGLSGDRAKYRPDPQTLDPC